MSKKAKKQEPEPKFSPRIKNKKATFNYNLLEKIEAGIVLEGTEVKSLRLGRASLDEAYCRIRNGELWMYGCNISLYEHGNINNHEPVRPRKLLIHKRELDKMEVKVNQKGRTIVPTRIYFSRGYAKVEVAVAQGKSVADKRTTLKDKQVKKDMDRAMRKWR